MKQTDMFLKSKTRQVRTKKAIVERYKYYGGSLNYRKLSRPFDSKKAIHLTMRSSECKNGVTLRSQIAEINKMIFGFSERFGVKVYEHAVNSNHIHLVMRAKDKAAYSNFVRALSGSIALKFKRLYRIKRSFWEARPFTRLVSWGRDFQNVCRYIVKNFKETVGFAAYTVRVDRYKIIDQFSNVQYNST